VDLLQKFLVLVGSIFSFFNFSQPKEIPKSINIIVTGDVMLGRTVMTTSFDKSDPIYPFKHVSDTLKSADLVFINLENPVIEKCPRHLTGFIFCTDPSMILGLKYAGVDVITLANNHSRNYGQKGFDETINHLENQGLQVTGNNNLVVKMVEDTKFGFLGFEKSQQSNPILTDKEKELIKKSNEEVDILIIAMHWGVEYRDKALPGVKSLAKELVALGGDVIVGHHPHWVQDFEMIDGVPVYYSLGNFIFDQMWSEKTREGLAIKLIFENKKFMKDEKLPTYMKNHAQPQWVIK